MSPLAWQDGIYAFTPVSARISRKSFYLMLFIALCLLALLVLSALITAYAAFPHRGADIPHAEWLSDAMVKAREKIAP